VKNETLHLDHTRILGPICFAILYFLGAEFGHLLSFEGDFATFWPPSGLFLFVLALRPTKNWMPYFLAALVANQCTDVLFHDKTMIVSLGFWSANAIEAVVGAGLIRFWLRYSAKSGITQENLIFCLLAACFATACGASCGSMVVYWAFSVPMEESWNTWWVCDLLGIIVTVPLLFLCSQWHQQVSSENKWAKAYHLTEAIVAVGITSLLIFGTDNLPLPYAIFPVFLWVTIRYEHAGLAVGVFTMATISVLSSVDGSGPFRSRVGDPTQVVALQAFICATAVSFYFLASAIQGKRLSENEIRDREESLLDLFHNLNDCVQAVDYQGKIEFVNRSWTEALGYRVQEAEVMNISDFMHPGDHVQYEQLLERLGNGAPFCEMEMRFLTKAGTTITVEASINSKRSLDGTSPRGTRWIFRDVTSRRKQEDQLLEYRQKLEKANQRLKELATVDGLTGLLNRRALDERFPQTISRCHRKDTPVSFALIDVDHFKEFNDTYGHQSGDDVLKRVGELLQTTVRSSDIVARYGGEEFAILMPETDFAHAHVVAERVRLMIEKESWVKRPITVSIGISSENARKAKQDDLIMEADSFLYVSKRSGRNRVSSRQLGRLEPINLS